MDLVRGHAQAGKTTPNAIRAEHAFKERKAFQWGRAAHVMTWQQTIQFDADVSGFGDAFARLSYRIPVQVPVLSALRDGLLCWHEACVVTPHVTPGEAT
ncbi:hypothetical protein [Denitromonas sp.]|uniref:hypothetical protein n=1 Tax=Denitromonas sp. TaxID=2734609 RepID=UPI003A8A28A7